jgi:hypothetical protein
MVFFFPLTVFAAGSTVGSAFGANIHLRQRIPFSQWNAVMSQAEAAGVQWGREEFEWDVVESTDNTFSFTAYDAVLNAYQEHNIEMLGLLTYSADWASSNPGSPFAEFFMPDEEAWRDYVRTVTSHYAGEVPAWEIWNEPNHASFWRSDIQEYATLVNSASEEIRAVDPDARIVLGGLSGTDTDYLARLLPLLDDHAIDIVAVHPYRHLGDDFNYAPEETEPGLNTLLTDLRRLDAVLERHDFEGNVWLTEVGWSTGDDGVTKKQQAQFLSRLYTIALSQTRIKKVFWYALTDTAVDASIEDAHFGLLTRDDERKKSFRAFRFLAQKMPGYRFRSLLLPGREWLTRFSKKTRWSTSDRQCTRAQVDARTKKKRLRIEYQFTDRTNCYVPVTRSIRMPTKARALSFRARGSSDPTLLRLRVTDRTGETFQYDIGELSASQWLTYVVQLDQHAAHWGGNNNGKLDRPLFFHAFVLDNAPGSLASGVARFDDLSASPIPDTMVMKWSDTQGRPPLRTFWKNGGSRRIVLKLKNATRARVIRIRGRILKQSNKKRYRVKATPFVKLLKRT